MKLIAKRRLQPWSTYSVFLTTLTAWAFLYDGLLLFLCYKVTETCSTSVRAATFSTLASWWFVTKFVKLLGHFTRFPQDIWLLPVSILYGYFHSIAIKPYAFYTLKEVSDALQDGLNFTLCLSLLWFFFLGCPGDCGSSDLLGHSSDAPRSDPGHWQSSNPSFQHPCAQHQSHHHQPPSVPLVRANGSILTLELNRQHGAVARTPMSTTLCVWCRFVLPHTAASCHLRRRRRRQCCHPHHRRRLRLRHIFQLRPRPNVQLSSSS